MDRLEAEIRVSGHENDTDEPVKNVNEPSVDQLERKIEISGHEKDKKELNAKKQKLNISEPSVDAIEKVLEVKGHEGEGGTTKKVFVNEPSVNEAEKELRVRGHDNETLPSSDNNKRILNMEPQVDGRLPYDRFKYGRVMRAEKLKHVEPSFDQLEKMIEIKNGSLNEAPEIRRNDTLPSLDGFHGVLMFDNESALVNDSSRIKPADLDDFKKWMTNQASESRLDRFKRLNDEFETLNRKMEDHDVQRADRDADEEARGKPSEKLKRAIREIEMADRKKRAKTDL